MIRYWDNGDMTLEDNYKTIRLPKPIIAMVDEYLDKHPEYHSRLEIINEAIRMHIKEIKK
jgi:metal-responsive CopG/Arc/MetJ family transcriptional regulator